MISKFRLNSPYFIFFIHFCCFLNFKYLDAFHEEKYSKTFALLELMIVKDIFSKILLKVKMALLLKDSKGWNYWEILWILWKSIPSDMKFILN